MANVNVWDTMPLFWGVDRASKDLGAESFLQRSIALAERQAAGAVIADAQKVRNCAANLRGQANIWWTKTLPNEIGEEPFALITGSWDNFEIAFKKEFFPTAKKTDASINWLNAKQMQGESVYYFLARLINAATLLTKLNKQPNDTDTEAAFDMPADANDPAVVAARAAFAGLDGAVRTTILAYFRRRQNLFRESYMKRYNDCLIGKVALNGLQDKRLLLTLQKSVSAEDTILLTREKVKTVESTLEKFSGGVARQQGGVVASITQHSYDDNGDESEEFGVNAYSNNKGQKGKKKTPAKGKTAPDFKPTSCSYCGIPGHKAEYCFKKKRDDSRPSDSASPPHRIVESGNAAAIAAEKHAASMNANALNAMLAV
jgi:hypothetical protein